MDRVSQNGTLGIQNDARIQRKKIKEYFFYYFKLTLSAAPALHQNTLLKFHSN